MRGKETVRPVRGDEIVFQIPDVLRKEFSDDLRIIIRRPWIVGIPVPERLIPEVLKGLEEFEVVLAPQQTMRFSSQDPIPPIHSDVSFQVPPRLVKEFGDDLRVVVRNPWVVGIPVPERLIPEALKGLKEFEVFVVPERQAR